MRILFACLLITSPAFAAEPAKAPPPAVSVSLTMDEMQVIASALNIAAGNCATIQEACAVGYQKGAIMQKLQGAASTLTAPLKK